MPTHCAEVDYGSNPSSREEIYAAPAAITIAAIK
jgi:hypothetical protein